MPIVLAAFPIQPVAEPPTIYLDVQKGPNIVYRVATESAIQRVGELNQLLANSHLSPQDRISYNEELFEILRGSGPGAEKYGLICGTITQKNPSGLPAPSIPADLPVSWTAWAPGSHGYVPTNDWFEQMATFPNMPRVMNSAGIYNVWYASSRYQDEIAALYSQSIFNFHNDFQNLPEVQKIHNLQADFVKTKNSQDIDLMLALQDSLQSAVEALVKTRNSQLHPPQQFPETDISAVAYFILLNQECGEFNPLNFQQTGTIAFPDAKTRWKFKAPTVNDEGITFKTTLSFIDWEDPTDPNHAVITPVYNQAFTLGADGFNATSPYQVQWESTGDGVRRCVWGDNTHGFTVNIAQGSVLQSASYTNAVPQLKVGGIVVTEGNYVGALSDGTREYQVMVPGDGTYYFFGNSTLHLNGSPYTGSINAAFLPHGFDGAAYTVLLEAHANVAVIGEQSALLLGDEAEVSLQCTDLSGQPTANVPLVGLKRHLSDALQNKSTKTSLSYVTLNGGMDVYAGSSFIYQFQGPGTTVDALPSLPNGSQPLTKAQCDKYLVSRGRKLLKAGDPIPSSCLLGKGIAAALNKQVNPSLYDGGKSVYAIATSYAYAKKILKIEGWNTDQINTALQPLFDHLTQGLAIQATSFAYNKDWGTIASQLGDYGNPNDMNDHIVQYGYWLYSMSLVYGANTKASQQFMSQTVPGTSYTYKDLGDLVASDIGQTGRNGSSPVNRNFDFYSGHSWLGGIGASGDGNNTESESEAVFGSMAITSWLQNTQPSSIQAELAHTRWSIETQGLKDYFHVDATDPECIYNKIAPTFAQKHLVMSMMWDGKVGDETFWGLNWDRILACELMPAGAQMADNYFAAASPAYIKNLATFIYNNWNAQSYDDNNIQSVLIAIVAKYNTGWAETLLNKVPIGRFDGGTSFFIEQVIIDRASNVSLHRKK